MFCIQCGAELVKEAKFCSACGKPAYLASQQDAYSSSSGMSKRMPRSAPARHERNSGRSVSTPGPQTCPACGLYGPPGAVRCDCGYKFQEEKSRQTEYAVFWLRAGALCIDTCILLVGGTVITIAVLIPLSVLAVWADVATPELQRTLENQGLLIGMVVGWLYYALMESSLRQATLGKLALGLKVTTLNGHRLFFWRATVRYLGRMVSSIPLGGGFVMAGVTKHKQALHDIMAECVVIREPRRS